MKALSVRQPWAWLIIHGGKDIENRTWATAFRGPVLIHASKVIDKAAYQELQQRGVQLPPVEKLKTGGIIGRVNIVDCVTRSRSRWFSGPVGFMLSSPKPLPFFSCPGRLSFFQPRLP